MYLRLHNIMPCNIMVWLVLAVSALEMYLWKSGRERKVSAKSTWKQLLLIMEILYSK